jgi:nicotinamide-nucleotide adenylyltransferase
MFVMFSIAMYSSLLSSKTRFSFQSTATIEYTLFLPLWSDFGMATPGRRSASLLAQVEQYVALPQKVKPLQVVYSTHPDWPQRPGQPVQHHAKQIDIGVLDSSFNPPHLAHAALAKAKKQQFADDYGDSGVSNAKVQIKDHYDSLLLVFSVRNADKGTGTKKDASTVNRLEMMTEFAKDLEEQTSTNVAVAIVEEPLMIAKSTLIHDYLEEQRAQSPARSRLPARLHWLVGFDTLQRFFQVKYYPSPDYFHRGCTKFFVEERTTFVCARRGLISLPNKAQDNHRDDEGEERALLESDLVKGWLDRGSIVMIDLDKSVQGVSSTLVRRTILQESQDKARLEEQLQGMTTKRVAKYLVQEPVYQEET